MSAIYRTLKRKWPSYGLETLPKTRAHESGGDDKPGESESVSAATSHGHSKEGEAKK